MTTPTEAAGNGPEHHNGSPKTSRSFDAGELKLMRVSLMALGRIRGDEPQAEIEAAWERRNVELDGKSERDRMEKLAERLRHLGFTPSGMNEAAMRAKLGELTEQRAKKYGEEELERRARVEQRQARERSEFLFRQAQCPALQVANLDSIDQTNEKWMRFRDMIVAGADRCALWPLLGASGPGKTQLAVSAVHRCCGKGMSGLYRTAKHLFRDMRGGFSSGNSTDSEQQIIDRMARYDVLAIDELHEGKRTDWEQAALTELIDIRYREMRHATILIANLERKQFSDAIGPSAVSRIREKGRMLWCDWPSYRRPGSWSEETK